MISFWAQAGSATRADKLRLAKIAATNPRLVTVSISPFGQTGPYRNYKSTNIVTFAMGGFMTLTGAYDREPLVSGGNQAEYFGGLHAFAATTTERKVTSSNRKANSSDTIVSEQVTLGRQKPPSASPGLPRKAFVGRIVQGENVAIAAGIGTQVDALFPIASDEVTLVDDKVCVARGDCPNAVFQVNGH
jgi:hypothetical protein